LGKLLLQSNAFEYCVNFYGK